MAIENVMNKPRMLFSITNLSNEGFNADIAFDTFYDIREKVILSYSVQKKYIIKTRYFLP